MRIIVYTAITNEKDIKRNDVKVFSGYNKFTSPVMNAKIYKVLAHKFLETDISIWVDGNIYLNKKPKELVDEWLLDNDMAIFQHYHKKDIYWEQKMLSSTFKHRTPWVVNEVDNQIKYYEETDKIPKLNEMAMGGFIIRRHNKKTDRFNEAWWAEITRWSQRDQVSLPVILKEFPELKINYIKGSIKTHPYLRYIDHSHYKS
jgi:hypothetical protein